MNSEEMTTSPSSSTCVSLDTHLDLSIYLDLAILQFEEAGVGDLGLLDLHDKMILSVCVHLSILLSIRLYTLQLSLLLPF